jgi:hypothetical protein
MPAKPVFMILPASPLYLLEDKQRTEKLADSVQNMPSKRRLSTSGGGEEDDDPTTTASAPPGTSGGAPEPGKKKRKLDPAQQIQVFVLFQKRMQIVYLMIMKGTFAIV